ncbi:hypothetical protein J2125_000174 [Erwinia toletana]|uniref:Uncharacterized protein n=1 Tax=Winslowiella toletana TaxID=92490 RepID=A0ABS4P2V5_9GAMM|nr:hypothetical protein [Winslowiella toletana]MBP2166982.1 hypothetical protein [Winslowiella toletana]
MKKESGYMFESNGVKVTLSELLNRIPSNSWDWRLYEFEGCGIAPYDMSMPDFEDRVASEKYGFGFTWDELREFSQSLHDVKSCVLAAVKQPVDYDSLEAESNDMIMCLSIYDSTEWELKEFD